ncbi:16S rRNA (cytidine(1402)-2'-O)-methyltransferase [Seleniivibrio woodruffii]|uniref:16S rRNA (Cytidine1402-2'-O)-methyltransferase n=1 Tax=Seleniivibrio woodruffii TaxID=1078050 RepID=A0A4R1K8I7_9BACT|nr:SAM-dependent methyltransferase [Seleniivibrio woodruffii]TCK59439.1 16S rRNA (cytidine1402-2'-O)-methyltransferase [Seleniivibrio woodruffii]TVZ35520.1 16S rRNA (cytidine1402-2'-O)-methyltransferase [Seleniivibrio woodruffii]
MKTLYIAGTSISGDYSGSPAYLFEVVEKCTLVIGEDKKNLGRMLAASGFRDREQMLLNEHSLDRDKDFLLEIAMGHENVLLMSDSGTPCVADPGYDFVNKAWEAGFNVISVPGPSSITAALSVSGYFSERFYFAGFPPKDVVLRKKFMDRVMNNKDTVVVFERPYHANQLIEEVSFISRPMSMSFNLGMPDEITYRGTAKEIAAAIPEKVKKPFVLVIAGTSR